MSFPDTRTVEQVDDFFGTAVPDPYRWLEDQTSAEVDDWVRAQAEAAEQYLQGLPGRDRLAARLTELAALPSSTAPVLHGGRWFRLTNDGSQQQAVLRMSDEPMGDGPGAAGPQPGGGRRQHLARRRGRPTHRHPARLVLPGGRQRLVPLAGALAGRRAPTWPTTLRWAKFVEPRWLADSSGFVYALFPPSDPDDIYSSAAGTPRLMLHRIGTAQEQDELVFELPDQPTASPWPWIDHQGRWLVIVVDDSSADTRSVWVRDLEPAGQRAAPAGRAGPAEWEFVTALPAGLVLRTDFEAARGRLVLLDPDSGRVSTLVAEREQLAARRRGRRRRPGGELAVRRPLTWSRCTAWTAPRPARSSCRAWAASAS